ncbi:hypothetical protein [Nocardia flavorosea]|uniref:Uncharacterized protein n=1 Tax=Nocardia flavorosea TaxID=53429 RepID=A0A846YSK9_9NOCA|nr:hypothetical protein [Nocardia flavorosea]NKY60428.1 hypothetical protein [Nocardia flavorosea]
MELQATITGGLECALCVHGAPGGSRTAVTITSGYALCEEHKWEFADVVEARANELYAEQQERDRERKRRWGEL